MANEITYVVSLSASKGGASINSGTISDTLDMTGVDMATVTQDVDASNEALDVPADVTGDVHLVVKNLDSAKTLYVYKDNADAHLLSKLGPGEACSLRSVPASSLYVKASAADCQIQFWICEA